MIRIINSSEELEVYVTYVITLDDDVGDDDQLRRDVERALDVVDWEPILEYFNELMYRWNGLWKYSLSHYVEVKYPSEVAVCAIIREFWEDHLLAHQNVEDVELKESHRV